MRGAGPRSSKRPKRRQPWADPEVRRTSRRLQRALAAERPPIVGGPQDPVEAASLARLTYVSDEEPGLTRVRAGRGFRYLGPDGRAVRDRHTLERIASLAIPPAWTEVWICPDPDGHIQAIGRDARRRKQYRYHPRWREIRDRTKFGRMVEFAEALPRIRRALAADLRQHGLPRRKVLAAVINLLEATCIRVGCDEYARANRHFGLTTLLNRHVEITGDRVRFRFPGKSGKQHQVTLRDPALARIVRNCQEIPGQRLFQYVDDAGERHAVTSGDVNEYLREISGSDFTAKDFRTWAGTTLVAGELVGAEATSSAAATKRAVLAAVDAAAERLGNTRAVCRASYVHPAVLAAFDEGWIRSPRRTRAAMPAGLDRLERATLRVLRAAAASARTTSAPLTSPAARAGRSRRRVRRRGSPPPGSSLAPSPGRAPRRPAGRGRCRACA
jgi:DNA topoisomerase-1